MSSKHFFNDAQGLVQLALQSLVSRNPHLALDEPHRVVFSRKHDPSKVTIISGGGSGHEPGWSGYVGEGMLSAAVAGDIFASPATKQVMAAVSNTPSDAGVILCITNYTGDILHFGLAAEKARAAGQKVAQIPLSDDVSLPRSKTQNLGRRGLAGNVIVLKLLGAASAAGWSFEDCTRLGTESNASIASIGTSLDLCHVMGRPHQDSVPQNTCVLGMGVHNEPGLRSITPIPTPQSLIKEMLSYVFNKDDAERNYVQFEAGDDVCLLVNNLGGLSTLELEALTKITLDTLKSDYCFMPSRIYVGPFETSLNASGFSISICNLTTISKTTSQSLGTIKSLLDATTTAPGWPKNQYKEFGGQVNGFHHLTASAKGAGQEINGTAGIPPAPSSFVPALKAACKAAIAAEPEITRFDTLMGDGDCGEGVCIACNALLSRFEAAPFTNDSSQVPLFEALDAINETLEDVGGSLFAIITILCTAFAGALKKRTNGAADVQQTHVGAAAAEAINRLFAYTGARVGDRTVMDALIPLCNTLGESRGDIQDAVNAAAEGAKQTANMRPRFGRATYVGDDSTPDELPPDPGAWAISIWLREFLRVYQA